MNLFTKIIDGVLKGIGIVTGFLPLVQQVYPSAGTTVAAATDDLTKIASAIQTAGVVATAIHGTGTQPSTIVAAAQPLVAQIVQQAEFVTGKKIANETLFTTACQELTQGMHDLLSALGD